MKYLEGKIGWVDVKKKRMDAIKGDLKELPTPKSTDKNTGKLTEI